jgi:PqqD family protein of HPr-rel-A system
VHTALPSEAATPAIAPQWIAAPESALRWWEHDGEHVLYHRPSGKTHFVNASMWLLLSEVLSAPRSLESLTAELASLLGVPCDEEFAASIATMIPRLEELGLVRRV